MDAVCFDMDGVIVDSERYWTDLEEERILPAAGLADVSPEEITGMNYREGYDYLDDQYGVSIEREEFIDRYERSAEEIYTERATLMDGFRDLCGTLRDKGILLAIVSSSPHEWIALVCDRFELTDFDAVVSAEEVDGPGKPEPDVYHYAADKLGVPSMNCVAVEDSVTGVQSATAAGMTCVGYAATGGGELYLSAAERVVEGPDELRTELLE